MELQHLRIQNFRNLQHVEFAPSPRFNILHGANGQGKTNLLEAIYLLSAVKSFRNSRNADLITWDLSNASIEGCVDRAGQQRIARVDIASSGKRVYLNGSLVRQLSLFFGTLNTIVFSADDLLIIKGRPGDRRQFLNRAVFSARPSYLADLQAYEHVLKQRNALLRNSRQHSTLLEVYNEQLSELGALLVQRRVEFLIEFEPFFRRAFQSIFVGSLSPLQDSLLSTSLSYLVPWSPRRHFEFSLNLEAPSPAELQSQLFLALERSVTEDTRRGFTTVGPHRDDLLIQLGDRSARSFASQGQMRAIILALKIAQIQLVEHRHQHTPILLLDDVSSELDRSRNRFLFSFLDEHKGQVFITTTHRDFIRLDHDVISFGIERGELSSEASSHALNTTTCA